MRARTALIVGAATVAVGLGGCLETDRPLTYEKGTYGGKPDQPLSPDQVSTLRERTNLQK